MRILTDFLLSGWSFFFRWPVISVQKYHPNGILVGPFYQALVVSVFYFFFQTLFDKSMAQFLAVTFLACLTGFFHEDGFSDTADSLGVSKFDDSPEVMERIHHAFKDSRLGAFGVSAACLLWISRFLWAFHADFSVSVLFVVYLLSRAFALTGGHFLSRIYKTSNGAKASHQMQALNSWFVACAFVCVLVATYLVMERGLCLTPSSESTFVRTGGPGVFGLYLGGIFFAINFVLYALTKRSKALNGDILGACVCLGEILLGLYFYRFFKI